METQKVGSDNMSSIVLNIPHSGQNMPKEYRQDILLDDEALQKEIEFMADTDIDRIFEGHTRVKCNYTRLLCDVERFTDDTKEHMAKLGMGVVYTKISSGKTLRVYDKIKRQTIIEQVYTPYHNELSRVVSEKLSKTGRCLVIDCHSYNEELPYLCQESYADICIGTDTYHTKKELVKAVEYELTSKGYSVEVNKPFSGTMVPLEYLGKDDRVQSIMIEINKRTYMESGETDWNEVNKLKEIMSDILYKLDRIS